MNKYVRMLFCLPCGVIKVCFTKIIHLKAFSCSPISIISPYTEISLDYGGKLNIGSGFRMRDGAKIRVRKGAVCRIGRNTSINSNCIITCHESIIIGNDVQFSPNVQLYDHDHDFRTAGGLKAMKFRTAPIEIGNNVWIGCNCVILRGTQIGDNCVIAAGSIVKGNVPANTIFVQERKDIIKDFEVQSR